MFIVGDFLGPKGGIEVTRWAVCNCRVLIQEDKLTTQRRLNQQVDEC